MAIAPILVPAAPGSRRSPSSQRGRYWRTTALAYLFLLPALVVIAVFHFFAVGFAFYISLFNWKVVRGAYLAFTNYTVILRDADFHQALVTTIWYAVLTVPVSIVLSLIAALLLSRNLRGLPVFRTLFFIPYVTSTVAAAAVWRVIFRPDGVISAFWKWAGQPSPQWLNEPRGLFQLALQPFGIVLPGWATGPSLALFCIAVMSIWYSQGFDTVVFLAGLTSIPKELYEAARLDGAGEWQLLRYLTWPLLLPTTFFILVISVIGSFKAFNQIYIMTGGGPAGTTTTVALLVYNQAFRYGHLGYASSLAFILFAIILGLTLVQFRVVGRGARAASG
ncbi:MAG TPA: sugar ABC transporter permease [Chloroflexota bacterium]|jgi:multiple sugar transport system permease protein|nr:sugar ABC transporter permease [Chloroflexota bacterium]